MDAGSIPRSTAPVVLAAVRSTTWLYMNGVEAATPGIASTRRITSRYSSKGPLYRSRITLAWPPRIRALRSASNPAITAMTTIRAMTPTATPAMDR